MQKMYSRKDVLKKYPISATTIWRMEKAGLFPKRRQMSPGKVGYVAEEVDEWEESRPLATDSGRKGGDSHG